MRLSAIAALMLTCALCWPAGASAERAPSVRWAVPGGGAGADDADGVGTDPRGRIVISGGFTGPGVAGWDVFATGYEKGGRVRWTRRFGGTGADHSYDNDVDSRGDAVLAGTFNDRVNFGGQGLVSRGGTLPLYGDAFLLKLGSRGQIKWVRQIGGSGSDGGDEVAVGPRDNIYVIGDSNGPTRFPRSTQLPATGGRDAWAARYSPRGGLVWARSLGGPGEQQSHGISADREGNALVTGELRGTAVFGSHRLTSAGSRPDAFIAKLDRRGRVRWARRFGDADRESAAASTPTPAARSTSAASFKARSGSAPRHSQARAGRPLPRQGRPHRTHPLGHQHGRPRRRGGTRNRGGPRREQLPDRNVQRNRALRQQEADDLRVARRLRRKVSPKGRIAWVVSSTDSGYATLGELSLGPKSVNVLGRFAGVAHFGRFALTSAGRTDFFLAQLRR